MFITIKNMQMRSVFIFAIVFTGLVLIFRVIFSCRPEDSPSRAINEELLTKDYNFSCHYLKDNDALPQTAESYLPQNSIFFIDASCKKLKSHQACSVESAARANPDRQVNLLFTSSVTWGMIKNSVINILLTIPNIEIARIHIEEYAVNTPLQAKFKTMPTSDEDFNMDLLDILKFLTLYKYDGVYLALDVIVARSFSEFGKNWALKTSPASISADMFSFSDSKDGRLLADLAVNLVVSDLARREKDSDIWIFDGKFVMKSLMGMWCRDGNILYQSTRSCPGVRMVEPEYFYPISLNNRQKRMSSDAWNKFREKSVFIYQIWETFTKTDKFVNTSLYGRLVQEYCPTVFAYYGEKFGIL